MKHIVREVFSLPAMDVVKASYKNSVYYIAGDSDITEYVSVVKSSFAVDEVEAIKHGLAAFLRDHPKNSQLAVPMYNLIFLDNQTTSKDFVVQVICDLFRKTFEEASELADLIHYNGACLVGTFTYEIAHTFACMVETVNLQVGEVLETDIIEANNYDSMDSLEVLERLIRRDFPGDI
jgi:ATP-dependent Clp protease adaptor protein ClpS